jgi:hypothetical protein
LILLSGCETAKRTIKGGEQGFSQDYQHTRKTVMNVGRFIGQTTKDVIKVVIDAPFKADKWIRKNIW